MKDQKRIGFVGLGIMGKPMAKNILKAGYNLFVFNRTESKMAELTAAGAHGCKNYKEVADQAEIMITMLPDSPEVEEVINKLLPYLKSGTILIDMSSISPLISRKLAVQLREKNIAFLDAPVSGGEPGAIAGTLAIMVGGEDAVFQTCLPVLQCMGKNVVHVGPVGSGGFTKLVNQIIVALNIAAVGEAFSLAQKAGLDVQRVYEAIRGGLAGSRVLDAKAPLIFSRQFQPGFKMRLHRKDLNNALQTGSDLHVELPLTTAVQKMIDSLCESGKAELDHGAIAQYFEQLSQVEIKTE